jgi:uncharacterized protein (DUF4415 family)
MKKKPLIDRYGEVREITDEDMKHFRPAREVLTPEQFAIVTSNKRGRGQRGPGKKPAKVPVSIRIDADIADALKTKPNWSRATNAFLREWLGLGA